MPYETSVGKRLLSRILDNKLKEYLVKIDYSPETYEFKHTERQKRLAHTWIDAGADIIVGAHPHVVQDVEVYKGVPIVYSLGNFLFDQTEKNTGEKGVQDGMTLHGKFIKDKLALYAVPIRIENMQPQLLENKEKEAQILSDFYKPWNAHATIINDVQMFVF